MLQLIMPKQYYDKKKEIEKKYLDDIKQLDDEYEAAIKNWISAKKIIL